MSSTIRQKSLEAGTSLYQNAVGCAEDLNDTLIILGAIAKSKSVVIWRLRGRITVDAAWSTLHCGKYAVGVVHLLRHRTRSTTEVGNAEEPVYYTARHLLQALNNLEDHLLDLPLLLVHGKDLSKPNLVHGIIPAPIPVDRAMVTEKKPSLLALAKLD